MYEFDYNKGSDEKISFFFVQLYYCYLMGHPNNDLKMSNVAIKCNYDIKNIGDNNRLLNIMYIINVRFSYFLSGYVQIKIYNMRST